MSGGCYRCGSCLLPDKEERAYFVAAAEKYNVYGMKGYADDGYCSEGVGYYNYGFCATFCCVKKYTGNAGKDRLLSDSQVCPYRPVWEEDTDE